MRGEFGHRVLAVGVDAQEGDALVGELFAHLLNSRAVQLGQRALGPHEHHHHGLLVFVIRQRMLLAVKVVQRKVLDLLSDRRLQLGRIGDSCRYQAHRQHNS
jgi:hypothetical protein